MHKIPPNYEKSDQHDMEVLCVKDVAEFLKISQAWVYKNYKLIGGVKIGGSVRFPSRKEMYERLFQQKTEMVGVLFPSQQTALHQGRVQNQERGISRRSRKKKGGQTTATASDRANRHGLLNAL